MMIDMEVYKEFGGQEFIFRQLQDHKFWLDYLQKYDLYVMNEELTEYGVLPTSLSQGKNIEKNTRLATENSQILYEVIDGMSDEVFIKAFFRNESDIISREDVMCKKLMFFLDSQQIWL